MAAGKYSFTIEQGTTHKFTIEYKDSNSNPVDLSYYHGRMQIRPDYADNTSNVYLTLSSSLDTDGSGLNFNGLEGTTPKESGSIGIYISADKTATLNFDEAYYDLEIYSGSEATRLLEGIVTLDREVTRV
jgi:hypothetical protein